MAATTSHARAPQPLIQVGRVGWAVRGLLYLGFAGVVWAVVSAGGTNRSATQSGGLDLIGERVPDWTLYGVAAGLLVYALWRLTESLQPWGDWTGSALVERGGYFVSFVVYSSLAWIAWGMATSDRQASGSGSSGSGTSLLSSLGGQLLVGAVGLVLLGAGLYFGREGVTKDFLDTVDISRTPGGDTVVTPLGVFGHLARGVVYGVFGLFLLRIATNGNGDSRSVDRALVEVGQSGWGRPLLAVTAIGLVAYGLYCLVSAPGQQLETPRSD